MDDVAAVDPKGLNRVHFFKALVAMREIGKQQAVGRLEAFSESEERSEAYLTLEQENVPLPGSPGNRCPPMLPQLRRRLSVPPTY